MGSLLPRRAEFTHAGQADCLVQCEEGIRRQPTALSPTILTCCERLLSTLLYSLIIYKA